MLYVFADIVAVVVAVDVKVVAGVVVIRVGVVCVRCC